MNFGYYTLGFKWGVKSCWEIGPVDVFLEAALVPLTSCSYEN